MLFVFLHFITLSFSRKIIRGDIYRAEYPDCSATLIQDLLTIYETGLPSFGADDEKCQFQNAVDWQMLYDFTEQNIFEKESYGNQWRERSFQEIPFKPYRREQLSRGGLEVGIFYLG